MGETAEGGESRGVGWGTENLMKALQVQNKARTRGNDLGGRGQTDQMWRVGTSGLRYLMKKYIESHWGT